MLRMRLRRTGAKKQPRYRIVIMESQSKRDGAFVDWLGFYDPLTNPPTVRVNEERTRHWLSKGVSMSDTVRGLLRRTGFDRAAPATETEPTTDSLADAEPAPDSHPHPSLRQAQRRLLARGVGRRDGAPEGEATAEALTEATSEALTEATSEALTEATSEALTEATSEALTEATSEALTEATAGEALADQVAPAEPTPSARRSRPRRQQ